MKLARGLFAAGTLLSVFAPVVEAEPVETGLSVRLRGEIADAAFFGPAGPPEESVLLTRALADIASSFAPGWRTYLQLGWHQQSGRARPLPTDENALDLQQAWIAAPLGAATLQLGRQELVLGSARLVGVRESPNIRRSFDGAVLAWRDGDWRVRALALTSVEIQRGAFNDEADTRSVLSGVYATHADADGGRSLDLYALHLDRDSARFAAGAGPEQRLMIGARLFGRIGALDYNIEPMIQTGDFADRNIRAWTIASDTGWTLAGAPLQPRFGLKANITSGDSSLNDGRLQTFDALFPNLAYFSEAPTLSPQNHIDVQPEIALTLTRSVILRTSLNWFWRTQEADAVYRAGGAPVPGTAGAPGRFTTRQAEIEVQWRPSERVDVRSSLVSWSPGEMLQGVGAEEGLFAMTSIAVRY